MTEALLRRMEAVGNRLPDPITLFAAGAFAVLIVSHAGAVLGWSATHPTNGEVMIVRSLLAPDGARWVWSSLVDNFIGFRPLGVVLVAMLGIGLAEKTGLVGAALTWGVRRVPRTLVTPAVVLAGVSSSVAADAGFVVLPPLAASIFSRFGRSPLLGIALAYVGVAGGFSANLLLTSLDPMLASATAGAAQLLEPGRQVSATSNYFFMVASVPLVVGVSWAVTIWLEPRSRLGALVEAPRGVGEAEDEPAADGRALALAVGAAAVVAVVLLASALHPLGPLAGEVDADSGAPTPTWMASLVAIIFVFFAVPGLVYGVVSGRIQSDRDLAGIFAESMSSLGPYIVLAFFCGQFVAWFGHCGLGTVIAIWGIEALQALSLPTSMMILGVVLMTACLNLFIGSASAKWFLLAPVFVPLLAGLGIEPELTQVAYRVGDSATNPVAPLNPYVIVIVVFMRRYMPSAGLGTVLAATLPYGVALLATWTCFLVLWVALGIPLGV